jgi:trimethylamine--corrinoid protein Co-methyltransferase
MVYLDRGLVRDLIATIPADFTYSARNPANNVRLGGRHSVFVPMTGAPYLRDLDDVRRNPTLDDLAMFHKLSHMAPALHSSAHHIVEPMDHPISHRHLRITYSSMKHSDKMFMGMTTSPKNAEDVMEMCAILFGEEFMERTRSPPAIATATRRWSGTRRCWARCAPSAAATSRCCARPSCSAAPTRPPRFRRPWRS